MKGEDPGRSAPLILKELRDAGIVERRAFSVSSVQRLLERSGLSGPRMEVEVPARHRFRASVTGELWQVDAVHGPKLLDPASGRETRVKVFGLLDDRSRLVAYLRGSFHERQEDFLRTLFEAIRRRGVPRCLLLDNHGSFTGSDVRVVCARLGIRLVFARPRDGASKGKIERFWRTLRGHVLDRMAMDSVHTLENLNLRLMTWVDSEYNVRPHAGIGGRTPLSIYEEEVDSVRFVSDHDELASHFVMSVERVVRNDATCTIDGRCYEVPQHLRRRTTRLHYEVLRPETVWIEDGGTRVFVREVDPVDNFRRARIRQERPVPDAPKTGLNAVDAMLARALHPDFERAREPGDEELPDELEIGDCRDDEAEGGAPCMPF
jgi:transposase InsO family protein